MLLRLPSVLLLETCQRPHDPGTVYPGKVVTKSPQRGKRRVSHGNVTMVEIMRKVSLRLGVRLPHECPTLETTVTPGKGEFGRDLGNSQKEAQVRHQAW